MGYNGEKASLNQYSSLYEYCKKHVILELESLFVEDEVEQKKLELSDLVYVYKPKKPENTPLISFDGGLSTLFKGTPMEVSLIKVSGACPPEHEGSFSGIEIPDILFHVFTGGLSSTNDYSPLLKKELNRLCKNDFFLTFLAAIRVDFNTFSEELQKLVEKWKEKSTLRDSFRELLEWSLIFDFISKSKFKKSGVLPFLVVKDGSLTTNARSLTGAVANGIKKFIEDPSEIGMFPVVGVVKSSRFVGESSIGRIVKSYASMLESHVFFQIPKKYEAVEDKDHAKNAFNRYFLSLFGGSSIYEIQIPKHIALNQEKRELIFDLISENVTFAYGGSVSINSFAHVKASLSEAEGSLLEKNLYFELKNKKQTGEE